jgi:hypothetical protein
MRVWLSAALLLLLAVPLRVPERANAAEHCDLVAGHIVSMDGPVEVQSIEGAVWRPAVLDQSLCQRETVRTGSRSRAALMLINEAVLRLDQDTTVHLADIAAEEEETSFLGLVFGGFPFSKAWPSRPMNWARRRSGLDNRFRPPPGRLRCHLLWFGPEMPCSGRSTIHR